MKYCLVTGSGGLVGSEAVDFFIKKGYNVIGIDNDMRKYFFGTSTKNVSDRLQEKHGPQYIHYTCDIRDYNALEKIFTEYPKIECVIHCAAQPSHDWAAKEPLTDFSINAVATLHLLELTRIYVQSASFIHMSTNKVYGDNPNLLNIVELEKRYEVEGNGIDETMSVDNCKHSIFGASKLASDVMVQEYGRYFNMNTVVFRGGCITGPLHQGAELHGFLSYLVKCIHHNKPYKIFGYKGKQVRDNIHSFDLVNAFWSYHQNPRPAAIYNIGGGRDNSLSILETIDRVNSLLEKNWDNYTYINENRAGDHIWYITDLTKFKKDYPEWSISYSSDDILQQIINSI
jgi:CDP-paratose 2-epimerase